MKRAAWNSILAGTLLWSAGCAHPRARQPGLARADWAGLRVEIEKPDSKTEWCDESPPVRLLVLRADGSPASALQVENQLHYLETEDRKTAEFIAGQSFIPLRPGRELVLSSLPSYTSLVLVAQGPTAGKAGRRTVELSPGAWTTVLFRADEVFETRKVLADFKGRLHLEGTDISVRDARIELDAYCYRAHTLSDSNGVFHLADVPADRILHVTIRAKDTQKPPRYDFTVKRVLPMNSTVKPEEVDWNIPAKRGIVIHTSGGAFHGSDPYPVFGVEERQPDGQWSTRKLHSFELNAQGATLFVSSPGTWRGRIRESLYVIRYTEPVTFDAGLFRQDSALAPSSPVREKAQFQVFVEPGEPAAGVEVTFLPLMGSDPPLTLVTDGKGIVTFGPVNVDAVPVRITGAAESFETMVTLEKKDLTPLILYGGGSDPGEAE